MKRLTIILLIILTQLHPALSQDELMNQIEKQVQKIERNHTLEIKEFDATEVFGHAFDGGGSIKIHIDQNEIKKIEQEIGLSYGRVTTIIYLENGKPIKIIDREENFPILSDQSGLDYSKLNKVFEGQVYIFDWDKDHSKVITTGNRNLSEGTCGMYEFDYLIELATELMNK